MTQKLPKSKIYRYCLADVAKGLFNGMIRTICFIFPADDKKRSPAIITRQQIVWLYNYNGTFNRYRESS